MQTGVEMSTPYVEAFIELTGNSSGSFVYMFEDEKELLGEYFGYERSVYRGHPIEKDKVKDCFVFSDTKQPVPENIDIKCGFCGKENTEEGHDGCLGDLIGLMNACCGHGEIEKTYVQFWDGQSIDGEDASKIIEILKRHPRQIEYDLDVKVGKLKKQL